MVQVYAGIDVSAQQLVVAKAIDQRRWRQTFPHPDTGHQALVAFLPGEHPAERIRVCLEPTGIYSLGIALCLVQVPTLEVMIPNPHAVHNFARAWMSRGKTDEQDAVLLLEFARRMPFLPWQPPTPAVLTLRELVRYERALCKDLAALRNRQHRAQANPATPSLVLTSLAQRIQALETDIMALAQEAQRLIATEPTLEQSCALLQSAPGIGVISAVPLMAELLGQPPDMTVKPWVARARLDVRERLSGTSVRGKPHRSKAGNGHVRHSLYLCAMPPSAGPAPSGVSMMAGWRGARSAARPW